MQVTSAVRVCGDWCGNTYLLWTADTTCCCIIARTAHSPCGAFHTLPLPAGVPAAEWQGKMELGDLDDPMNAWHFGERDELFKYRLIGTHPTMSGA